MPPKCTAAVPPLRGGGGGIAVRVGPLKLRKVAEKLQPNQCPNFCPCWPLLVHQDFFFFSLMHARPKAMAEKLREIAKTCEKLRNCGKSRKTADLHPPPSCLHCASLRYLCRCTLPWHVATVPLLRCFRCSSSILQSCCPPRDYMGPTALPMEWLPGFVCGGCCAGVYRARAARHSAFSASRGFGVRCSCGRAGPRCMLRHECRPRVVPQVGDALLPALQGLSTGFPAAYPPWMLVMLPSAGFGAAVQEGASGWGRGCAVGEFVIPGGGGGGGLERAKFGMAKFGAVQIWHEFLNTTAKFGTKFPDCGIRTSIHCKCNHHDT